MGLHFLDKRCLSAVLLVRESSPDVPGYIYPTRPIDYPETTMTQLTRVEDVSQHDITLSLVLLHCSRPLSSRFRRHSPRKVQRIPQL